MLRALASMSRTEVIKMNGFLRMVQSQLQMVLAALLCLALPAASWANIANTATATYSDAALNNYTATSNAVTTVTPPVITSAATASGNLNSAFTPYQITATNSPTSYGATGLPTGLTLATTGIISGTPTVARTFAVTLTATNAAGTSAPFTLTITIKGTPSVVLTKSADKTTAISGAVITYTIQYQNTGGGDATNLVIKDVIPTGTTLVTGSITGGGTLSGSTISWTIGTVTAGAAAQSVSFKVTVN